MKAHVLHFAFAAIAAAVLVSCSPAKPDAMATLKKEFADRPVVADADNAFLDAMGFLGPAAEDAHELGARRVAWLQKYGVDPKTAGDDPGKTALDLKASRSQSLRQVIDACRAAFARACGSAIERARGDVTLSEFESLLLARYDVLLGRRGWHDAVITRPRAPLAAYSGMIEAQRLMLIRLIQTARAGDVEKVQATLSRDLAYWRMVFVSSDLLISKMMALAAIRQHFALGTLVLRALPADRVMEAVPEKWQEEFSADERSMRRVIAGEFLMTEGLLLGDWASADKLRDPVEGEERDDAVIVENMHEMRLQPSLSDYADYYLATADGYRAPLTEYEAVSRKLGGEYKDVIDRSFDLNPYALRFGSAEGMRRAALLTVQLRSQSVPVAEIENRLRESPLRNPYNGEPFVWDAADHAIVFTGPEDRKYRRQAYLY